MKRNARCPDLPGPANHDDLNKGCSYFLGLPSLMFYLIQETLKFRVYG